MYAVIGVREKISKGTWSVFSLALFFVVTACSKSEPSKCDPEYATCLPWFEELTLDGKAVSAAEFRGKPTIVSFVAPWCPPCHEEAAMFSELWEKSKDSVAMIGVIIGPTTDQQIADYVKKYSITYPIVMATDSMQAAFRGKFELRTTPKEISDIPLTFFYDASGRQTWRVGAIKADRLAQIMKSSMSAE